MAWTDAQYRQAIAVVNSGNGTPDELEELQRLIKQHETRGFIPAELEPSEYALPGIGATPPVAKEPKLRELPDVIGQTPDSLKRPGTIEGESIAPARTWYEPSLDEFRAEMAPVIGEEAARSVTEDDTLFQRYADAKWAEAFDTAKLRGKTLQRYKDISTETTEGKIEKALLGANRYVRAGAASLEEGVTGGLPSAAVAKIAEMTGFDPDASEELERERSAGGAGLRTAGNIGGMLLPGSIFGRASKAASGAAAPLGGAVVLKGGGNLPSRIAGRAIPAMAGGAGGLAAHGAAADLAQGLNPFSPDFLSRRGEDLGYGALGGAGSELLGSAASGIARGSAIGRAKDAALEASRGKQLNPILEALTEVGPRSAGAAAGGGVAYALSDDRNTQLLGALAGATILGSGWGRYALLRMLAERAGKAGATEVTAQALAKQLQTAPLPPDVVGAIRDRAITRGAEVFGAKPAIPATPGTPARVGSVEIPTNASLEDLLRLSTQNVQPARPGQPAIPATPPQTGRGGGPFGLPFTSGAERPSPTTLSKAEAEAFVQELIDEQATVNKLVGDRPDAIEGTWETGETPEPLTAPAPALEPAAPDTEEGESAFQPTGFPSSLEEGFSMVDETLGRNQPTPQSWQQDKQFTSMLANLEATLRDAGIPDAAISARMQGYIKFYDSWREVMDAKIAAGEPDPKVAIPALGQLEATGFARGTDEKPLRNDNELEHVQALPAELKPDIERVLKKRHPEGFGTPEILRHVVKALGKGATLPPVDVVEDTLKNLGYTISRKEIVRYLKSTQETTL